MNLPNNRGFFLAALAALLITLSAWFLPLPPIIAGQEALASKTVPQTRTEVQQARDSFNAAQNSYQSYIHTHDLAALLTHSRDAIARAKQNPGDAAVLTAVRDAAAQITAYANALQQYAAASDHYFATLQHYDNDLMSWTRSLGAASESLRPATFPFVEHLKKYPLPVGETPDPPAVTASEVATQTAALQEHLLALAPDPNPQAGKQATLTALDNDISAIWASGRSVEYIASLHADYDKMLQTYDTHVAQTANSAATSGPTGTRRLLASGLNILLGLLTIAGIATLLAPRERSAP